MTRHVFFVQGESHLDMHLPTAAGLAAVANLKPVPEWVHIMPLPVDGRIASRDYRELVIEDAAALVKRRNAAIKRQQGGGLVDFDHRTYGKWSTAGGGVSRSSHHWSRSGDRPDQLNGYSCFISLQRVSIITLPPMD